MYESAVERKIIDRVKAAGGVCLKWVSPGFSGVPDRIAILPGGRILFIEVKRPHGVDGKRQPRVHALLRSLGAVVIRAEKPEDLDGYL